MRTKNLMFLLLIFSLVGVLLGQTAEQLPIPVNFNFTGDILSWDIVPNAVGYTVAIFDFPADQVLDFDVTENEFKIPDLFLKEFVRFEFKAIGDNIHYLDSEWSISFQYSSEGQLPFPMNLKFVGDIFSWNMVNKAIGYNVIININGETTEWIFNGITENSLKIPNSNSFKNGISLRVQTNGDNIDYFDSEWSYQIYWQPQKIKLATPTNLKLDDDILSWDEVENAIGYTIDVRTDLTMIINIDVPENSFNIPDIYAGATFAVVARGDNINYIDSDWSETIGSFLLKLPTPTNLKLTNNILTWDYVETISGIRVSTYIVDVRTPLDILIHIMVTENSFNIPEQYADAFFAVKAMGDNIYYSDSEWSEQIQAAEEADEERLNENDKVVSQKAGLLGNYPNPFNPTTSISFVLPNNSFVNLDVYNMKGQKVRSLAGGSFTAGQHSIVWNGRDDNGSAVSSGVYFYRITTNEYTETKKMIMIK